jgi:hypothetical protein
MLAFPEMLKSLTPIKSAFSKGSSFRKHFFEKVADILAIILSIYLAVNIEGWSEKRNEHKRLLQYYSNLVEEIERDTLSLTTAMKDAETHIKNAITHLELVKDYKPEVQDSVLGFLGRMMSSEIFSSSQMVTYKSMLVSGEIKLIDNIAVRDSLIELDEIYSNLKIYEDMYLEFIKKDLINTLRDNFDLSVNKLINEACFSQLQYRNMVAMFQGLNAGRLGQYKDALPKAKAAREVIIKELQK